ncbi:hypothetical protein ACFQU1_03040 [Chelatococcus sp. GCM10030263]|uniref:hypothetical protein n=1 Tax=Chelatococcus sp. GCM10030263 TaxID=3273387 RepID=UPI003610A5FA
MTEINPTPASASINQDRNQGNDEHHKNSAPSTSAGETLQIGAPLKVPANPTTIVLSYPEDSTVGGALRQCGKDYELIEGFKPGIDKLKFGFDTKGFVSEDVQTAIDSKLLGSVEYFEGPDGGRGKKAPELNEAYQLAVDVPGVENGHLFYIKNLYGRGTYLAVENDAQTLIGFGPLGPTQGDVIT